MAQLQHIGFQVGTGSNQVCLRGLLHISRMDKKRVAKVEDVMNLGDKVLVRVIEIDPKTGKISLDRKGLLPEDEKKDN